MKSRRLQSPAFSLTKVWEHAIKTVISKAFFGGLVAMLVVAKSLREIAFGKLMDVYQEGNLENGADRWPDEPEGRQIALAEEDFYNYLQQVFFKTAGAVYLVWEEKGIYVSALRLEAYRDGLLLTALETHPQMRRRGYGQRLVAAALEYGEQMPVYSHVNRKNTASLRTHEKCGFKKLLDYAVYADGSVNDRCCTLRYCK